MACGYLPWLLLQMMKRPLQQVTGKPYRVKVMEESNVGTLSTKANPVDDIIRRAGELDITLEIND